MSFRDYFSTQAAAYAAHRPGYPMALFAFLAEQAPDRHVAWDVGTGSGQVAVSLAGWFGRVIGTDPSRKQLRHARRAPRVSYMIARAEDHVLRPRTVDLVTVGQALHWIELEAFYAVVRAVLRPAGVIAVWTYDLARVAPAIDRVVDRLYTEVLSGHWAPERRIVDDRYRSIPFPFAEVSVPPITMTERWTFERFIGYLGTWSAVRTYRAATGVDPVAALADEIATAWGDPQRERPVRWPLTVRAGRLVAG